MSDNKVPGDGELGHRGQAPDLAAPGEQRNPDEPLSAHDSASVIEPNRITGPGESNDEGGAARGGLAGGVRSRGGRRPSGGDQPDRWRVALNEMLGGSVMISILSIVLALITGAILIAISDKTVQATSTYFFSRPGDMLSAIWNAVSGAYVSLFQGAVYNFKKADFFTAIRPLTQTLNFATPLIVAGLGIGLGFRVGLFNIGGRGQMLMAIAITGWIGFGFDLPAGIHMIVAVIGGLIGGAIWGGLVGVLKAKTGAHEVIVTIMLNYVAFYFVSFLLRTPGALQAPGSNNPKSPAMKETAVYPLILGEKYPLNLGFVFAVAATVLIWWILTRSSLGFKFRAVGENPNAARVAGINVSSVFIWAMTISGALVGLAGVSQVLGTVTTGFSSGIDAGIGFDAITVALLGRSRPWGILWAGILFGAFKAGGYTMQAAQGIPIDIVLVVQSMIVLFIAAPPLVRAVFNLPTPGVFRQKKLAKRKVEAAK